jgi:LPXTG-motif cell wall-anchored protein
MAQNHVEEQDGCDHGHTGKACKPDPSTNGKDCEVHGQHGGVNEDHCLTTSSTTTTTGPTVTTVTTTGTTGTTATTSPSTTTTTGPGTTTTSTSPVASPSGTTPTSAVTASPESAATTAVVTVPASGPSLAYTGASSLDLAAVGIALVISGLFLRRRASRG